MDVFTLGYERTNIETYMHTLETANVDVVVDVRLTAWSYKRDFCKRALMSQLAARGIEYLHVPSAGNPKEHRGPNISAAECLARYERYIATTKHGVADVVAILNAAKRSRKKVCLTCYERDAHQCHRSILLRAVSASVRGLDLVHLTSDSEKEVGSLRIPQADNHEAARIQIQVTEKKA